MDSAALMEREALVMMQLRSAKSPDLVEDAAEACSRGKALEPGGRPIALFDSSMVLL
jgi:hypothetical protein